MTRKAKTAPAPVDSPGEPMRQNATDNPAPTPFAWSGKTRRAAALVAEDVLTDAAIATQVKTHRATLDRWKRHPEFAARVAELVQKLGECAERFAIGRRHRRVAALDDRWEKMQEVIRRRGADKAYRRAPGGKTGLLVRTEKQVGAGDNARIVEEFAVDTALLKELREHERQAAQELGQWLDKHEHGGPGGGAIAVAADAKVTFTHALPSPATVQTLVASVMAAIDAGAVLPDGVSEPVDSAAALAEAGTLPSP